MKKYNLGIEHNGKLSELFIANSTEEEVKRWLVRDVTDIMQNNFVGNEKDYLFNMKGWSESIMEITHSKIEKLDAYLESRGYAIEVCEEVQEQPKETNVKRYKLIESQDLHLTDATEEEIRVWLVRDKIEGMHYGYRGKEQDYLSDMEEQSNDIVKIIESSTEELKEYLKDRDFIMEEIVTTYEVRVSINRSQLIPVFETDTYEKAKEEKERLLALKSGDQLLFKYVEIWDKEKNECLSYTCDTK